MVCLVCDFLEGGFDYRNRTVAEILAKDDDWLESTHDYIQWLFPLDVKSFSNRNAPVVLIDDILRISESDTAQQNLQASVKRMKEFWVNNDFWIKRYDHNHLRFTRVIKSLRLLSGPLAAEDFKEWLFYHLGLRVEEISPKARNQWAEA